MRYCREKKKKDLWTWRPSKRNYPKWKEKGEKTEKEENSITELWENFKLLNIHVFGIMEEEEGQGTEKNDWNNHGQSFSNFPKTSYIEKILKAARAHVMCRGRKDKDARFLLVNNTD